MPDRVNSCPTRFFYQLYTSLLGGQFWFRVFDADFLHFPRFVKSSPIS